MADARHPLEISDDDDDDDDDDDCVVVEENVAPAASDVEIMELVTVGSSDFEEDTSGTDDRPSSARAVRVEPNMPPAQDDATHFLERQIQRAQPAVNSVGGPIAAFAVGSPLTNAAAAATRPEKKQRRSSSVSPRRSARSALARGAKRSRRNHSSSDEDDRKPAARPHRASAGDNNRQSKAPRSMHALLLRLPSEKTKTACLNAAAALKGIYDKNVSPADFVKALYDNRPNFGLNKIIQTLDKFRAAGEILAHNQRCDKDPHEFLGELFCCLMIGDASQHFVRDELLFRGWNVVTLEGAFERAPDLVYITMGCDRWDQRSYAALTEVLVRAQVDRPSLHVVCESTWSADDAEYVDELSNKLDVQFTRVLLPCKTTSLWILNRRISRLKTMLEQGTEDDAKSKSQLSHGVATLVAQFFSAECELRSSREWSTTPSSLGELSLDGLKWDPDEGPSAEQSRIASVSAQDLAKMGWYCDDAQVPPNLFGGTLYPLGTDIDQLQSDYELFYDAFWRHVDYWSDEFYQAWMEWVDSGEPFDLQDMKARLDEISTTALYSPNNHELEPYIGMKVRKLFYDKYHMGRVTRTMTHPDGTVDYRVKYNDGDSQDMSLSELLQYRQGRNRIPSPWNGRAFRMIEFFAGCCFVTEEFFQRQFQVISVDISPLSNATHVMDIADLDVERDVIPKLGGVPDFCWFSPPCITYSNLANGKHHSHPKGELDKTSLARNNNRHLTDSHTFLLETLKKNPNVIIVFENPVGAMDEIPIMKRIKKDFDLEKVIVDYCAFGRDEKKPTCLWTNSADLAKQLRPFTCKNKCIHGGRRHPGKVQGSKELDHAAIPESLALLVARVVDSVLERDDVRHTP